MEILDIGRSVDELKAALEVSAGRIRKNAVFLPLEGVQTMTRKETIVEPCLGGYKLYNSTPMFFKYGWPSGFVAEIIFIGTEAFIKFRLKKSVVFGLCFMCAVLGFIFFVILRSSTPGLATLFLLILIGQFFAFRYQKGRFRKIILNYLKAI